MAIYNGTPEQITFYAEADTYEINGRRVLKTDDVKPIKIIPSGVDLKVNPILIEALLEDLDGIPLKALDFDSVDHPFDAFPESKYDDFFIVSTRYQSCARQAGIDINEGNLLALNGEVYFNETSTNPCGYLNLIEG